MLYKQGLLGRAACPGGWYPDHGPPTIDDTFVNSIPAGWTFTRSSANATNCLYSDAPSAPAFVTYATNAPRFLMTGLLMEPQRTNLFLNSEAPVTQTIAVTNGQAYTVWMHGTGSVAVAGSGASGSATHGIPYIFTANATGNVTCTLTAPVTRVQFEAGPGPSSYIAAGATAATRTEDRINKNYLGGELNAQQGTYWIEWSSKYPVSTAGITRLVVAGVGSYSSDNNTDQIICYSGAPNTYSAITVDGTGAAKAQSSLQPLQLPGSVQRTAAAFDLHRCRIAQDGNLDLNPLVDPNFRPPTLLAISLFGGGNNVPMNGFLRSFKYWPISMGDDALKDCTTPGYYKSEPVVKFDFTTGSLPREITWSRAASTGVVTDGIVTDAVGSSYNTFALTVPRLTSQGLFFEPGRSNYLWPSAAPVASRTTVSLGVQRYCMWMIGTGSCTVAGTTATITDAGKGLTATQGNPIWFDVTVAGTVTVTSTGTLNRYQLEQCGGAQNGFAGPTSFIGTDITWRSRGSDNLSMNSQPWYPTQRDCTMFLEWQQYPARLGSGAQLLCAYNSGGSQREQFFNNIADTSNQVITVRGQAIGTSGGWQTAESRSYTVTLGDQTVHKCALAIGKNDPNNSSIPTKMAFDGVVTSVPNSTSVRGPDILTFAVFTQYTNSPVNPGRVRRVRVYDYLLSDADLIALTT